MKRRYFIGTCSLLAALALSAKFSLASTTATPIDLVESFHQALLKSMKSASTIGVQQRYETLGPVIRDSFHAGLIIQVTTGSYWRKADTEQRKKLIETFERYSTATYAAQFNGYSGQLFETVGQKPGPQETILVETRLLNPQSKSPSKSIALTYVTRKIQGRWWIIDVLVDTGISELARKRSEYRRILKTGGIDGLVKMLASKTSALLAN